MEIAIVVVVLLVVGLVVFFVMRSGGGRAMLSADALRSKLNPAPVADAASPAT